MRKLDHLLAALGLQRRSAQHPPSKLSRYHGADINRLTSDWQPMNGSADSNIRYAFTQLRDRARQLERDNDYVRRYLAATENNVLGCDGFNLQNKAKTSRGGLNKEANRKIEDGWIDWGKKRNCTLNREDCFVEVQKLLLRSAVRDGAIFWRGIKGADNDHGYAIELIEIDQLDTQYTGYAENGNRIFMGVEKNSMNRVVAYHMFAEHPGDVLGNRRHERIRVPVETKDGTLKLYFFKERVNQSIGVTWLCSAMTRLHFLGKYEEAEVMAARAGAEKGGWFTSERGEQFAGDEEISIDADGNKRTNVLNDFEPGSFDELPDGMKFIPYTPVHPNTAYGDFTKGSLFGISAGLNIDYATLTNDLSEANYSSMRNGKLESQETWKSIQGHMMRNFIGEVFDQWLPMAAISGAVNIPYGQLDSLNRPLFRGRRWPWVDPAKDVKSAVDAIANGLDTRTNIVAQNGGDIEDIIDTVKEEKLMMDEAGVTFGEPKEAQADPAAQQLDEDGNPISDDSANIQSLKMRMDAYGVGVRAGTITPTKEDENYFRAQMGLPTLPAAASESWTEDEGYRRPITLVPPDGMASIGAVPGAPGVDDGEDGEVDEVEK